MKNLNLKQFIMPLLVGLFVFVVMQKPAPQVEPVEPPQVEVIPELDTRAQDVEALANANGFKPSKRIIDAVVKAAETYQIDPMELTAIGIIETGLGKYAKTRLNSNGTHDKGVFQINTVNYPKCVEYNLDSPEGSALCAAKLLSQIKAKRADYMGVYHSKTCRPDFCPKKTYLKKVAKVLAMNDDK